ncbi:MAG: 30S ribosome-binding factor RbfA [Gemmatimonadetes bacterium]|nr:30S ribosome-binding factor RbfA [Gemmatimonadota bacterium]
MQRRRLARLNEQLKREISGIIRREVRDPRVGIPMVTSVAVSADLFFARVYVRPDPTSVGEGGADFLVGLATAAPFIRRELGKFLKVRRVPELRFEEDRALEHALRIDEILRSVQIRDTDPEPGGIDAEGAEVEGAGAGGAGVQGPEADGAGGRGDPRGATE